MTCPAVICPFFMTVQDGTSTDHAGDWHVPQEKAFLSANEDLRQKVQFFPVCREVDF